MSIEPFFRDEPFLRDEPPDTRKEAITVRPDDDLFGVDTPPTYAMGLAERLAALHQDALASSGEIANRTADANDFDGRLELTTVALEDLNLDESLEDFDSDGQFDRETLPSAPYPALVLDDGAANLPWDVLPAPLPTFPQSPDLPFDPPSESELAEDPRSPVSSSLWGKLQKLVHGIGLTRSQPPVSSVTSGRLSQRAIYELVWTLDNAALDGLAEHIERIIATRRLGPEAYAESRIIHSLDNMMFLERGAPNGVSISILRARIPEVARNMFDHALLRLENRGIVALLPDDPGHDGILDPVRGHLSRCVLLQSGS
jgi:hypothetical protein